MYEVAVRLVWAHGSHEIINFAIKVGATDPRNCNVSGKSGVGEGGNVERVVQMGKNLPNFLFDGRADPSPAQPVR